MVSVPCNDASVEANSLGAGHIVVHLVVVSLAGRAASCPARNEKAKTGKEHVKIYLASSWRNAQQPAVLQALRSSGHEVYDFRNPAPGDDGFHWSEIDPDWKNWTPERYAELLASDNPIIERGFGFDKAALDWCDTCVCLLPCGRSAHLEAGYAIGQGKPTFFLLSPERFEPELMYLLGQGLATDIDGLLRHLGSAQG